MSPQPASNDSEASGLVADLIRRIFAPTAILTALAYFIGWAVNAAYYLSFGLPPSSIRKSVPEILTSAWLEIGIACVFLILFIFLERWVVKYVTARAPYKSELPSVLSMFFFLLIMGLIGAALFIYLFAVPRLRLRHLIAASLVIFLIWLYTVLGRELQKLKAKNLEYRFPKLFEIFFPNFFIFALITVLATIFLLNRVGIWRGVTAAEIDIRTQSLPSVSLYLSEAMPDCDKVLSTNLYKCSDLWLIDSNDEFVFVYRENSRQSSGGTIISDITTYIIPQEKIALQELHQ